MTQLRAKKVHSRATYIITTLVDVTIAQFEGIDSRIYIYASLDFMAQKARVQHGSVRSMRGSGHRSGDP